ncbi:hypothetical protein A2154_01240 [Candidatus Gottesmanbacteria bacterium RBG_16_43_7]|uniref:Uncharacterized protein n=1 Tax=Candidatus Gottesmanbacteria bacterium RBG_16_43_7 TaxID=1798373 RepID=A0A1F5Z9C2_9BACT|nr:MAG: hypothetical protein A2154_01240 [Candidatus Gottesmanbacteria bacterium RBG_16_43_7]
MDDRQRSLAAVVVVLAVIFFIILVVGAYIAGRKIISPVPDTGAIRIIFLSPTPQVLPSVKSQLTPADEQTP